MKKFKQNYNYQKMFINCINNNININVLNFDLKKLSEDFKDIKLIYSLTRKNHKIEYFDNCYILPIEIMSFFINLGLIKLDKFKKEILNKNNDMFLFHEKGIEIGKINNEGVFIQKYILCFKDKNIFELE